MNLPDSKTKGWISISAGRKERKMQLFSVISVVNPDVRIIIICCWKPPKADTKVHHQCIALACINEGLDKKKYVTPQTKLMHLCLLFYISFGFFLNSLIFVVATVLPMSLIEPSADTSPPLLSSMKMV
jgi:hypothetical protein